MKTKKLKRALGILLALAMCLTLLPNMAITSFATGDTFSFILSDNFSWGTGYVYAWDDDGNALTGEWPGTAAETTTNEYNETQFIVTLPMATVGVIVNNGNGAQTESIDNFCYEGYWMDGSQNELGHYIVTGYGSRPDPRTAAPADTYIVAGNCFSWDNWDATNEQGKLTKGTDGKYRGTFTATAANGSAQFKVVKNGTEWIGDENGNNVTFAITEPGEFTITLDPATNEITVTGDIVAAYALNVENMYAVGSGKGNFLNNISWNQAAAANKMTEVSENVWEITYENVAADTDYQVKFAADGSWTNNWGNSTDFDGKTDGTVYDAEFNSESNILFGVTQDNSTVTLRLDLSEFVFATKAGAKFSVLVTPPLTSYDLYVGGVQVTSANASNVLGDGTVSYNNSTKTLTLNGANITSPYNPKGKQYYGIYAKDIAGLQIVVQGNSVVDIPHQESSNMVRTIWIENSSEGNATITCNGNLTVKAETSGINITKTNLTVNGSGTLSVESQYGIVGNTALNIDGNATVNLTANSGYPAALLGEGGAFSVNVGENATLNATSTYWGTQRVTSITSAGTTSITSTGGYGVYGEGGNTAIQINGGSFSVSGTSWAIRDASVSISSGLAIYIGNDEASASFLSGNSYGGDAKYVKVTTPTTYEISITAGAHMTKVSGDEIQTVNIGDAITNVVYTADSGYCFPDWYEFSANGLTVAKNSATQITVSGTPVGNVTTVLGSVPAHSPATAVNENVNPSTCEDGGSYDEVVYCYICGEELSREGKTTDPLNHNWGEPVYDWTESYDEVQATRTCLRDSSHIEGEGVSTTSEVTKPATTTEMGETTYTATFSNPAFTTQTKTVANIPMLSAYTITVNGGKAYSDEDYTNEITSALPGTKVYLYPTAVAGKYVVNFHSYDVDFDEIGVFTMPDNDVVIDPMYMDQTPVEIDLSNGTAVISAMEFAALYTVASGDMGFELFEGSTFDLDLDKDGTNDIHISVASYSYPEPPTLNIEALSTNSVTDDVYTFTEPNVSPYYPVSVRFVKKKETVSEISFLVTNIPKGGEKVATIGNNIDMIYDGNYTIIPDQYAASLSDCENFNWFEGTFQTGTTYYGSALIIPADGYVLSDALTLRSFTVGDATPVKIEPVYTADDQPTGEYKVYFSVSVKKDAEVIDTVSFTGVTLPMDGDEYYDAELADGEHYTVDDVYWLDGEDDFPDTFELGNDYYLVVTLTPERGYIFADSIAASLNGGVAQTLTADDILGKTEIRIKVVAAEAHTITFNANGAKVTIASDTTGADGTLDSLPIPTRSGYTFKGWYTAETGGTKVTSDTVFDADTEIFAQWTKKSSGGSSATTYAVTPAKAENGTAVISTKNALSGSTVTVTVTPDEGYKLDKLTVTDQSGKEIEVTEKDGEYTFTMPSGKVDVTPSFVKDDAADTDKDNDGKDTDGKDNDGKDNDNKDIINPDGSIGFVDVKNGDYFYDAVLWAVKEGITSGTSNTTFSPNDSCTRAQTVTFLWRAAGSPEPATAENPFTDVSENDYFYKAVLWGFENGITLGTADGKFSPGETVTRAQAVSFLHRMAQKQPEGGNPFEDVAENDYYYNSVLWAYENNITNGTTDTTFSPEDSCLRGQIVSFLYRIYK